MPCLSVSRRSAVRTPISHRVGEIIGRRYRLISPLGQGGCGVTFRAWDDARGVPVVLKMPLAKHLERAVVLERFSREVTRLRDCRHPHIVPIIDDGQASDGRPFIVMRFLPGGSLADRKKPINPVTLHRWLPAIADALDYIHGRGVLHRDVKPANIFFDTQVNAFLGDFGIARLLEDQLFDESNRPASDQSPAIGSQDGEESLTATGQMIGTLPYMAPELFDARPLLTARTDQYSLAVTVYEMVTNSWPFKAAGREGFRQLHQASQQIPLPSAALRKFPTSLANSLDKALARTPEDRFATCGEFAIAVLAEVPFQPTDSSQHRFLCPGCGRLMRVPENFGGRTGRCPACYMEIRASHALDALWRPEESVSTFIPPSIAGSLEAGSFRELLGWRSSFDRLHNEHNGRTEAECYEVRKAAIEAKRQFSEAEFKNAINLLGKLQGRPSSPMLLDLIWLCEQMTCKQTAAMAELNRVRTSEPVLVRNFLQQASFRGFALNTLRGDVATILPVVLDYELALWKAGISDRSFNASKRECESYLDDLWARDEDFGLSEVAVVIFVLLATPFVLILFVTFGTFCGWLLGV